MVSKKLSNPEKYIKKAVEVCANISKKQQLAFPEDLVNDRKNNHYRTAQVNTVFQLALRLPTDAEDIKKGEKYLCDNFSPSVAGSRIELPTLGL